MTWCNQETKEIAHQKIETETLLALCCLSVSLSDFLSKISLQVLVWVYDEREIRVSEVICEFLWWLLQYQLHQIRRPRRDVPDQHCFRCQAFDW